jgi:hypothetical protein
VENLMVMVFTDGKVVLHTTVSLEVGKGMEKEYG